MNMTWQMLYQHSTYIIPQAGGPFGEISFEYVTCDTDFAM